jgi:hypothetical protein
MLARKYYTSKFTNSISSKNNYKRTMMELKEFANRQQLKLDEA